MRRLIVALGLLLLAASAFAQGQVDMIYWEHQSWMPGGSAARLTLWADGRSEITVRIEGTAGTPRPGWTVTHDGRLTLYHKANPLSREDAKHRFAGALAAGIRDLRTFPPGYNDGSGTEVGVRVDNVVLRTTIPMFLHPGEKDNQGSDNEKRFHAVEQAIGTFDTAAVQR